MFCLFKSSRASSFIKCSLNSNINAVDNANHLLLLDGSNLINKCYYTSRKMEVCPGI